jgi:aromatic ring hydroxylase
MHCMTRTVSRCLRLLLILVTAGFTQAFYKVPRTTEELVASRDPIAEWARIAYGWMGRSPDYKASLTGTLGANSEYYAPYQKNALSWYS